MTKPKISFCVSHPIQYLSPLLKEMALEFDLQVYYFSEISIKGAYDKGFGKEIKWDIPLLEGYNYKFIRNYSFSKSTSNGFFQLINPGIISALYKDSSPIVMINGWSYCSDLITIVIAKLCRKKVWLRAENPLHQELRKSKHLLWIKKIALKYLLFKLIDRFLYIGTENKKFFKYYGVSERILTFTPYSVNNSHFESQFIKLKEQKRTLLAKLNLPVDKRIILFCGKYIEQKRPLDLLKAFLKIKQPNTHLIMVGEGPLREQMEDFIKNNCISNITLTGFINQSRITEYYSIANIFVMCSGMGETWGLAVNEAMNFHLPIVISDTCGSSKDLVIEGLNGFIFNEGDIKQLSDSIEIILADENLQKRAGEESAKIINQHTNDIIVRNILQDYAKI